MLITYLRSSSYTTYDFCPHKYFLSYGMGMREPTGKKANLGSIAHKVLETLARKALAIQEGKTEFYDAELDKTYSIDVTDEEALEDAWEYYTLKEPQHKYMPADHKFCAAQVAAALEFNNGTYNPANRKIVMPEQYFDLTIDQPWAHYRYKLPNGEIMEGQLAIKGTMDLILEISPTMYEYCDWKTGMRKDWATGKEKDYKKLRTDPQLLLYFYALTELYPDIPHFMVSIVFTQAGGPFTMPYQREVDRKRALQMLEKRFTEIKNCYVPKLKKSWKCTKLCHFGKTNYKDSDITICQHFANEVRNKGMDRVVAENADIKAVTSYGDGGGQSNREE